MALTITKSGNTVSVVGDGAAAVDLGVILGMNTGTRIPVQGISYYPAAAANVLTVHDEGAAGAILWKVKAPAADVLGACIMFPGGKLCKPYVAGADLVVGSIVTFHLQ
jgi:hypothetical protein